MNKLSPDLMTQIQDLENRANIAEQKVLHKNAEVQAAQEKLQQLDADIAHKTERLLAKQAAELVVAQEKIAEEVALREAELKIINKDIVLAQSRLKRLVDQCQTTEDTLTVLGGDIKRANERLKLAHDDHQQLIDEIKQLNNSRSVLIADIATQEATLTATKEALPIAETALAEVTRQLEIITAEFAVEEKKKAQLLVLLDEQILLKTQEIEQRDKEETLLRRDMANWQKALEERDKNLRIRELKTEESETKMVRNSSLLNL